MLRTRRVRNEDDTDSVPVCQASAPAMLHKRPTSLEWHQCQLPTLHWGAHFCWCGTSWNLINGKPQYLYRK